MASLPTIRARWNSLTKLNDSEISRQLMNDEIPAGYERFAPLHRWPSDATRQSCQSAAGTGRRAFHRLRRADAWALRCAAQGRAAESAERAGAIDRNTGGPERFQYPVYRSDLSRKAH